MSQSIEQFFAARKEQDYRDLLGRYALAWASEPVQKLARNILGLDLLAAVGVAQELEQANQALARRAVVLWPRHGGAGAVHLP
jgi:3-deoxy-D-manno-octulosonate 8-phosphate phosphatase KdsC-like HAD superfamily phosphatase